MMSSAKILLLPWKCQYFEHMHQTNHNKGAALMQSNKKCEIWAFLVQGHLLCSNGWDTSHAHKRQSLVLLVYHYQGTQ